MVLTGEISGEYNFYDFSVALRSLTSQQIQLTSVILDIESTNLELDGWEVITKGGMGEMFPDNVFYSSTDRYPCVQEQGTFWRCDMSSNTNKKTILL